MERITAKDNERIIDLINSVLIKHGQKGDYTINFAYTGWRVERANNSVDVSPRLSKRELYQWLHAFKDGIFTAYGEGVK